MVKIPLEFFVDRYPIRKSSFSVLVDDLLASPSFKNLDRTDRDFIILLFNFMISEDNHDPQLIDIKETLFDTQNVTIDDIVGMKKAMLAAVEEDLFNENFAEENSRFFNVAEIPNFYQNTIIGDLILHNDDQFVSDVIQGRFDYDPLESIVASNRFDLFEQIFRTGDRVFLFDLLNHAEQKSDPQGVYASLIGFCVLYGNYDFFEQLLRESDLLTYFNVVEIFSDVVTTSESSDFLVKSLVYLRNVDSSGLLTEALLTRLFLNLTTQKNLLDLASDLSLSGGFILNDIIYTSVILLANNVLTNRRSLLDFKLSYTQKALEITPNLELDVESIQTILMLDNLKMGEGCA